MGALDDLLASPVPSQQPKQSSPAGGALDKLLAMPPPEKPAQDFSTMNMVKNIPKSGYDFGKNMVTAVAHPIDTAKALGNTALGAVDSFIPGQYPEADAQFSAVKDFFKQRYGGLDNIKKTVENDPVGFAADLAGVLGGAGGLATKAGELSKLGTLVKAGSLVSKVGEFVDPLSMAGKALKFGGNAAAEGLGITTGAGGEAVRQVFTNSNPALTDAMRGKIPEANIVEDAKGALTDMKEAKLAEYAKQLPKAISNPIKFDSEIGRLKNGLYKKFQDYGIKVTPNGELDFSRSPISNDGRASVVEAVNKIIDWGSQPGDMSVEGLDTLKRQLYDLTPESGEAKNFVNSIRKNVRDTLVNNVPEYEKLVGNYEDAANLEKDIQSGLSLTGRAGSETVMRKLNQALKQNFEFRKAMIDKLDAASGSQIVSQLAGNQLSSLAPRGLARFGAEAGGVAGAMNHLNPAYLGALALSSPRLVGEFLNLTGRPTQVIGNTLNAIPSYVKQGAFQSGRVENIKK